MGNDSNIYETLEIANRLMEENAKKCEAVITIKNLRKEKPSEPWDIVADRTTFWGNPYKMLNKSKEERDRVCDLYEADFKENLHESDVQAELWFLKEILKKYKKLNIFCWCAPDRCHTEALRDELLDWYEKCISSKEINN